MSPQLEIRLAAGRTGVLGALFSAHLGTVLLPTPVVSSSAPLALLSLFYVGVSAAHYVMLRLGLRDPRLEGAVAVFEPVAVSFGLYSVSGVAPGALAFGLGACLLASVLRKRPLALLLCWATSLYLALLSCPGTVWGLLLAGLVCQARHLRLVGGRGACVVDCWLWTGNRPYSRTSSRS